MDCKVVSIDQAEMACLMIEALLQVKRPPGMEPHDALKHMNPAAAEGFMRAAEAVFEYVIGQLNSQGLVKSHRKLQGDDKAGWKEVYGWKDVH